MTPTRIVIVGGGSYAWGPLIVRDIVVTPELRGSTIVLHDINAEALDLVFALGQKIVREHQLPYSLEKSLDLDQALRGAEFVILTITTGGLEAMRYDLEIPARCGIYQSVGDTVGPGGLARALRNIPVVAHLARRMEAVCPQAWLLNYTNPMTTLCRAVTRETKIKTVGLCHEFLGVRKTLKTWFGVRDDSEIQARVGGINHLIWILELKVRGQDAFPELYRHAQRLLADRVLGLQRSPRIDKPGGVRFDGGSSFDDHNLVKARLFQIFGALPAAGDRHVAEFFPHFLTEATDKGRRYGVRLTGIDERHQIRARDRARLQSLLDGTLEAKPFLSEHSGEAASRIVAAMAEGGRYVGILNLPNRGQIANLPADVVVETFGMVDSTGAHGIALGQLPPGVQTVVNRHVTNQETIVEAALTGDRSLALQALVNDPLVRDLDSAEPMLEEMLLANRQYLPQFFSGGKGD